MLVRVVPQSVPLGGHLGIEVQHIVVEVVFRYARNTRAVRYCSAWMSLRGFPTFCALEATEQRSLEGHPGASYQVRGDMVLAHLRLTTSLCLIASRPLCTASGVIRLRRPSSSLGPQSPQALKGGPSFCVGRLSKVGSIGQDGPVRLMHVLQINS